MKWTQSDEELQNFLSRANNLHPSIKFTHEISNTTISSLDTSSSLSEGVLFTDLYSKPTDTNQYLLPSSCHPPHVTNKVKLLESGEFVPPTNLWKNDWVNLKIIWKEGVSSKVLSRIVLTKLITSPGAVYFSTKKNRNVKEPLVSSHIIPSEKQLQHHSWALDIRRKKFKTVQSLSWSSHGCLQTTKQSEKSVGAGRNVNA